jgi:hypothetical protein
MPIFTLVDEGAVPIDAYGARTRILDNHHSHDSDQRNTQRLARRGRSGKYFTGGPCTAVRSCR